MAPASVPPRLPPASSLLWAHREMDQKRRYEDEEYTRGRAYGGYQSAGPVQREPPMTYRYDHAAMPVYHRSRLPLHAHDEPAFAPRTILHPPTMSRRGGASDKDMTMISPVHGQHSHYPQDQAHLSRYPPRLVHATTNLTCDYGADKEAERRSMLRIPLLVPSHHLQPLSASSSRSSTNAISRGVEDNRADKNSKRLRISRACQHCKSRKTRCDAIGAFPNEQGQESYREERGEGEEGNEGEQGTGATMIVVQPCTNCLRAGIECFYSKKQLKRGPSKGYIKELEKRLDSLESTLEGRATSPIRASSVVKAEKPEARLMRLESVLAREKDRLVKVEEGSSTQARSAEETTTKESPVQQANKQSQPRENKPETSTRVKEDFLSSHLSHCLPVLDPSNYTSLAEMGMSEGVLIRAVKLLVEPVKSEPGPSSSASHPTNRILTHGQRLQHVIGQASMGGGEMQTKQALGSSRLSSLASSTDAIRAKQKIARAQLGLESDSLILCYLDALRRGQANGAPLAAAVSKLTMIGSSDGKGMGRRVVAMIIDRWHSVAFNLPFHIATNSVTPLHQTFANLLSSLPDGHNDCDSITSEILRGAMVFGLFREALETHQGVGSKVTRADLEAILYSMELDEGSDATDNVDAYSTRAMRPSMRNALRAYHALYQLPRMGDEGGKGSVTVESVDERLRLVEGIMCVGCTGTVVDVKFHIIRSYVGPFVLSIITVLLAWLSRVITFLARQALLHLSNPRSRLQTLEHLRRKVYDWLRLISPLSLYTDQVQDNCNFSLLHSRVSMFAHSNVSYTAQIGNLGNEGVVSFDDLGSESPVRDEEDIIRREADGILDAFHDLGPLGLALSTTHEKDAWVLLEERSSGLTSP